jgi:hypothetical protein
MHRVVHIESAVADHVVELVNDLRVAVDRVGWGKLPVYNRVARGRRAERHPCYPEVAGGGGIE